MVREKEKRKGRVSNKKRKGKGRDEEKKKKKEVPEGSWSDCAVPPTARNRPGRSSDAAVIVRREKINAVQGGVANWKHLATFGYVVLRSLEIKNLVIGSP